MTHFNGSSTFSVAVEVSGYLGFTRGATEEFVIHDPDEAFGFDDVETYVSEEVLDEEKDEIEYSVHFSGKHFLAVNVQDRGSISEAVNKAMEEFIAKERGYIKKPTWRICDVINITADLMEWPA